MNREELYHYGILGQKWGVRRYQNPDGSLTEAGKKRYRVQRSGASESTKTVKPNGETGGNSNQNRNFSGSKESLILIGNNAKTLANETKNIESDVHSIRKQKIRDSVKTEDIDYKELKRLVDRMSLEKQYKDLKSEEATNGRKYVEKVIAIAGSVITSAVSIAALVSFIKANSDKAKMAKEAVSSVV